MVILSILSLHVMYDMVMAMRPRAPTDAVHGA